MAKLFDRLAGGQPFVLDGAWGTQLQALGLGPGACPDEWNLSNPDRVTTVARGYVEAGSQIILTNTFGANRIALKRYGLEERAAEINRAGTVISLEAAGSRAVVVGSIGPTGLMLSVSDVPYQKVCDAFREQADALAEGGAAGFVIETMSDLDEAECALLAAKSSGLPVIASMVFDSGPDGLRTMTGVTVDAAARRLSDAGADVVGANCGHGPEGFLLLCEQFRASASLPIWMKPNAGLPELIDGEAVYRVTPEQWSEATAGLVDAGAVFIGGCCGTSPTFIRTLRQVIETRHGEERDVRV